MPPFRSVLYMPGSNPRALQKARDLPADALILDLEDAVAPDAKASARQLVAAAVAEGGYGRRHVTVRINALDTPWGAEDLAAAAAMAPNAIVVPKVDGGRDIAAIASALGEGTKTKIWAMIETPKGVLNAGEIAAAPGMEALVTGTNDLAKELRCPTGGDRMPMLAALSQIVLAARAGAIACLDGVFNAIRDEAGLHAECLQGKRLGFDGKTLIHPAQLEVANAVFAPSKDDIAAAQATVAAFDEASARGEGIAVLDGRIIENLHAEAAREVLAKAEAIADMS